MDNFQKVTIWICLLFSIAMLGLTNHVKVELEIKEEVWCWIGIWVLCALACIFLLSFWGRKDQHLRELNELDEERNAYEKDNLDNWG